MTLQQRGFWQARPAFPHDVRQAFGRFFQEAADASSETQAGADRWVPRVDIREEADRFVILADLPGVDPSTIEVSMDKHVLTLKGERAADSVAEGGKYTRVERVRGRFDRRFALPETADAEGIVANGRHGVLEIAIPKKAQAEPRRITINAVS